MAYVLLGMDVDGKFGLGVGGVMFCFLLGHLGEDVALPEVVVLPLEPGGGVGGDWSLVLVVV